MSQIQTFTGRRFSFDALMEHRAVDVSLDDIAQSLSQICRFNGHCPRFISVAEHSVVVCRLVQEGNGSPEAQRLALLHDAHKAYVGDIVRPLRKILDVDGKISEIVRELDAAIFDRFGIRITKGEEEMVSHYDNMALAWEKHNALTHSNIVWGPLPAVVGNAELHYLDPPHARDLFLSRCRELGIQ